MSEAREVPLSEDALALIRSRQVAVLGFGAQGAAHALNLRDSGCRVLVGQRPQGARHAAAIGAGFEVVSTAEATRRGDLLIFAFPDDAMPALYEAEIAPHLRTGQALGFIHGFAIHYRGIVPPTDVDVVLVAPKAQGRMVRSEYVAGRGVLSLIAVQQDATGDARSLAIGWAMALGSSSAGLLETTFRDETETDLFGEQAVLCGGLTHLILAGFETLVEAGYPPQLAYFECCHEVKIIADLIYERGIAAMRERISSTARFGDVSRGARVISKETREQMRAVLEDIRSGRFAEEFAAEAAAGHPRSVSARDLQRAHPIESIGARMRALMWGLVEES